MRLARFVWGSGGEGRKAEQKEKGKICYVHGETGFSPHMQDNSAQLHAVAGAFSRFQLQVCATI